MDISYGQKYSIIKTRFKGYMWTYIFSNIYSILKWVKEGQTYHVIGIGGSSEISSLHMYNEAGQMNNSYLLYLGCVG